jgi:ABC-type transport system involved in multi-copper enzyme maturation permease subunit
MSVLPIVARELRVAARKRSTFWLRIIAALVAFVIGAMVMVLSRLFAGGTAQLGTFLFGALTWLGLAVALSAGVFFTSDCLSEEKREGTLGLLFLTDLRGWDVVLGKLAATSLRGAFALLAVFPMLGITLLMGGVTGALLWKTSLALLNALLCSLAAGMLVSAMSRDAQKAMGGTVALMLLLIGGSAAADSMLEEAAGWHGGPIFNLINPGYVFASAGDTVTAPFWTGLVINQAALWLALGLASVLVRRTWQERARKSSGLSGGRSYAWRYGSSKRRSRLRRGQLERNPVLWLAARERWQSLGMWALALAVVGASVVLGAQRASRTAWSELSSMSAFVLLGLYLWAASQAGRFFVEARRTGLIELILAAPVTVKQVVGGQWRALLRLFGLPVALLLGAHIAVLGLAREMVLAGVPVGTGNSVSLVVMVATIAGAGLTALANLLALGWFGMWMGMTSKNNNLATLKTITFVQIVPWFITTFASYSFTMLLMLPRLGFMNSGTSSQMMNWFPLLLIGFGTVMALGKDAGFVLWSRSRLYANFREQAAHGGRHERGVPAAPVPPPIPTPPIIPAQA